MSEVGAIIDEPEGKGPISLGRAWHEAVHGFVAVIAAVVIGLGYLVPIALMGLALLVGWLGFRRARTRERPVQAA